MLSYEVFANELLLPFEVDGHSISFAQIWVVMGYSDVVASEDKVSHGEDFGAARLWFVDEAIFAAAHGPKESHAQ